MIVAEARRILKKKSIFFCGSSISSVLDAGSEISRTSIAAGTVCLPHALGNV